DVRLDRRAAGAQPDRARPAVLPLLLRPRLSRSRRGGPACLPRRRDSLCAGHRGRDHTALAEDSRHAGGAAAGCGDAGLLGFVRARRHAGGRRPARMAAVRAIAVASCLRRRAQAGRAPDAGHVRTCRISGLSSSCARRTALALERRHRRAAAARQGSQWMSLIHGEMQPYALTLDRFLDHAAKWHPDVEVVTAREGGRTDRIGYAGLRLRSRQMSVALAGLGVAAGECVATLAWNTQAHVETWFAVTGMGAVCHTLNPRLSEAHLVG